MPLAAFALFVLANSWAGTAPLPPPATPPDVILITVDGLGHADVGFNGGTSIETPNMDRLAAEGVVFANGYVPQPLSSAARAALLTGRHPSRLGFEEDLAYAWNDPDHALPDRPRLLSERLAGGVYATGLVGKWHLGANRQHAPLRRGFDHFFGFVGGTHDYWRTDSRALTDETLLPLVDDVRHRRLEGYLTDVLTDEAIEFIQERPTALPYFLHLAYNAPHAPLQAPQGLLDNHADVEDESRRTYLAMVEALDAGIGRLLRHIDGSSQRNRSETLIFLVGERSGASSQAADNGALRGERPDLYEGGLRVPFAASWPSRWPQGGTFEPMVSSLDVTATIMAMATGHVPQRFDGVNLEPFVRGETSSAPHEALYWRRATTGGYAVRSGDMKLVRNADEEIATLYDLAADPGETNDLLGEDVDKANELAALWNGWNGDNTDGNLFTPASEYETARWQWMEERYARRAQSHERVEIPLFSDHENDVSEVSQPAQAADVALTVSVAPEAIDEGESAKLTIALADGQDALGRALQVRLAVFGTAGAGDYLVLGGDGARLPLPRSLDLPAGETSVTATIEALGDDDAEAPETVIVQAQVDGVEAGSATLGIGGAAPAGSIAAPLAAPAKAPNVVVVYADDLGHFDLSVMGATDIHTPNIDRIAAEGVLFSTAYAAAAVCSPSRAALVTGRHPATLRVEANLSLVNPFDPYHGLPAGGPTVAGHLRGVGYRTAAVGKWHLGTGQPHLPNNQGFDYYSGRLTRSSNRFFTDAGTQGDMLLDGAGTYHMDNEYLTDVLTDRAIAFATAQPADVPFFLSLAYFAPHVPFVAPAGALSKFDHVANRRRAEYLAVVHQLDRNVGRLLQALDEAGLRDDTLIYFLGDHGAPDGTGYPADNGRFRGGKGDFHEGGLRIPMFASWPGRWPQGVSYDAMVSSLDVGATAVAMAQAKVDPATPLDGVSLDRHVRGESVAAPHEALFWRNSNRNKKYAVRAGNMKLVGDRHGAELFDLEADPGERNDVLAGNAQTADRLGTLWKAWDREKPRGTVTDGMQRYRAQVRNALAEIADATRQAAVDQRFSVDPFEPAAADAAAALTAEFETLPSSAVATTAEHPAATHDAR